MRWMTYRSERDGGEHAALLLDGEAHALPAGVALVDLLADGQASLSAAAEQAVADPFEVVPLPDVRLLAPVPRPPSVRDFMSFENHYKTTREAMGAAVEPLFYEQPCFYFQNPAAVIGPDEDVAIAPGSVEWDYELELAAVVGRPGRDLSPQEAEAHIAGYMVFCDWSARDHQKAEVVFTIGPHKGKDTATSTGPFLVTPDELEPYRTERGYDLAMTASVNGRRLSEGSWASIHWSFPQMLAYASRGTELRSGDVIGSGTVGTGCLIELSTVHSVAEYPWLVPGDEVVLEVEQLGALRGRIRPGAPVRPLQHAAS
jgi:2-keto-4-pentenoate hydratase/2-oxohepta-3-ene-1,7-dioic acid hydratase in catechol pathway